MNIASKGKEYLAKKVEREKEKKRENASKRVPEQKIDNPNDGDKDPIDTDTNRNDVAMNDNESTARNPDMEVQMENLSVC